ncbi:unannotated protein [freshwater metagenome]|uniref:Unannotated protein n=1 Tax=freshwater metagenome TaxID=449393 RepID=A0A6J6J8G4_9ZZZZ
MGIGIAHLPGSAIVGHNAIEVGDNNLATINATFIIEKYLTDIFGGLGWIITVWQKGLKPSILDQLINLFNEPAFTFIK